MLARYFSLKAVNIDLLHKHFSEVWRNRTKMLFTPLRDNFFIITFTSEGDFNFVNGGGPWIHQGVACLIAPFVNNAQPSESVLDSVRLWVRFYDVPWNKQTDAYGRLLGGKLGKVVEVDVDEEGLKLSDYLRVRIDWPLSQRLLARFRTTVKGQPLPRVYPMMYERVPFFCFHCGLIGHNPEQCEAAGEGKPSLNYDATLRCSPKRKFEGRTVGNEAPAKRNLRFNTPDGSVNSSSLGRPKQKSRVSTGNNLGSKIPPVVDAYDGFDTHETGADTMVEDNLANTVNNLQLQLGSKGGAADPMPGTPNFVTGGASNVPVLEVAPLAMQFMQGAAKTISGENQASSGPHSSDMIPPIRGLAYMQDSDVSMSAPDSVLGKRTAEENEVQGGKLDLSLALNYDAGAGGQPKKGKTGGGHRQKPEAKEMKDMGTRPEEGVTTRTRRKIATGHAAADNLTRSRTWSRQAQ
jgi:hypothetical protein